MGLGGECGGVAVGEGSELEHHVQAEASGLRKSRRAGVINLMVLRRGSYREQHFQRAPCNTECPGQTSCFIHWTRLVSLLPRHFCLVPFYFEEWSVPRLYLLSPHMSISPSCHIHSSPHLLLTASSNPNTSALGSACLGLGVWL